MSCFEATITARLRKGQAELAYCRAVCRLKQRSVRVQLGPKDRSRLIRYSPLLTTCWELAFKHPEWHYTFVHRQNVRIIEHPDPTAKRNLLHSWPPSTSGNLHMFAPVMPTWWYTVFEEDLSLKTANAMHRWNPEALDWQQWLQACT